jgi:hypothetical protein
MGNLLVAYLAAADDERNQKVAHALPARRRVVAGSNALERART